MIKEESNMNRKPLRQPLLRSDRVEMSEFGLQRFPAAAPQPAPELHRQLEVFVTLNAKAGIKILTVCKVFHGKEFHGTDLT